MKRSKFAKANNFGIFSILKNKCWQKEKNFFNIYSNRKVSTLSLNNFIQTFIKPLHQLMEIIFIPAIKEGSTQGDAESISLTIVTFSTFMLLHHSLLVMPHK